MTRAYSPISADQMRAAERSVMASGRLTGPELMERAGLGVIDAIFERWPRLGDGAHRAVVLCGPGNNGGDGFVVARLLKQLGWHVTVFFYGDADHLPSDARANHDLWNTMGTCHPLSRPKLRRREVTAFTSVAYLNSGSDLVIDALFGIGLTRPIRGLGPLFKLNRRYCGPASCASPARHVSIDIPSGLTDSGPFSGNEARVMRADLTVTFHRLKHAHIIGAPYCGKRVVKDIGL